MFRCCNKNHIANDGRHTGINRADNVRWPGACNVRVRLVVTPKPPEVANCSIKKQIKTPLHAEIGDFYSIGSSITIASVPDKPGRVIAQRSTATFVDDTVARKKTKITILYSTVVSAYSMVIRF